jgi:type VI secretion system protein ImpK
LSSAAELAAGRPAATGALRAYLLAVSAFHSESTRARLDPAQLHRTLEQLLAGHEAETRARGDDWELYLETKYALVALADDLALNGDWDHAETWGRWLLELRHFNTSFAGAEFFDRLHRLRQRLAGVQDPRLRQQVLATLEVYYTCLRLGFRGRYRGAHAGELESVVAALQALLWPAGEKGLRQRVWSEAYTTDAGQGRVARRRRLWWWPVPASLVAAVLLWFLFSWTQTRRVDEIVRQAGEADGRPRAAGRGER